MIYMLFIGTDHVHGSIRCVNQLIVCLFIYFLFINEFPFVSAQWFFSLWILHLGQAIYGGVSILTSSHH